MKSELVTLGPPFYAEPGLVDELNHQYGILPPNVKPGYDRLETTVSSAFLDRFGAYLSDEQRRYFEAHQMVFVDPATIEAFPGHWDDEHIDAIEPEDAAIDGLVYLQYAIGSEPEAAHSEEPAEHGVAMGHQLWAGRIALYGLSEQDVFELEPRWLMSEAQFAGLDVPGGDRFALIPNFVYTNAIGSDIIHEKVHGVQDWRLPLPILEASAHYYEREVFQHNQWEETSEPNNFEQLAELYGECVAAIGEDVHRLIFGTLEPARRTKVLSAVKARFTAKAIAEISGDMWARRHIRWQTEPLADYLVASPTS